MHEINKNFKSGFITVVGRPNSGKSTLINTIIGKKISITSNVAQTTRHRLRAILNKDNLQAIFVDTPGLHKPHDVLGQELNEGAFQATSDCDIICMVIDCSQKIGSGDIWVADKIKNLKSKKICVLSKLDIVDEKTKMQQIDAANKLTNWDAFICLSSFTKYNIDAFMEEIYSFLPYGPMWFPKDVNTDQPIETLIAEYIREKILNNVYEEIPHCVGLDIESFEYFERKNLYKIYANVYVEKQSQKGILIGKNGKNIKQIGIDARKDLENMLSAKVFLDLQVKIKKDWRKDYNQIRKFGYTVE